MNVYQEPKYKIAMDITTGENCMGETGAIVRNARLVNRQTNQPIPDDEPVLVLRAKDCYAAAVLDQYARMLPAGSHKDAVSIRAAQFRNWADEHPDRVKEPTTEIDEHWTTAGSRSV